MRTFCSAVPSSEMERDLRRFGEALFSILPRFSQETQRLSNHVSLGGNARGSFGETYVRDRHIVRLASCWLLACLIPRSRRSRQKFPQKSGQTTSLRNVTVQNRAL
jgi:hypothetical protein